MTTRNNLTTMLHNLGFDDVRSISQLTPANVQQELQHPPTVVLLDGHARIQQAISATLNALQLLAPQRIPIILLLTSRELKQEYLRTLHPFVSSVIFKPVSPRLLHHQLQRFLAD